VHDPTPAYAFVHKDGAINIRTVSDTVRAAKVNAIVIVGHKRPTSDWTDMYISQIFEQYCTRYGSVQAVSVQVTP
jgi:hypothetical protein